MFSWRFITSYSNKTFKKKYVRLFFCILFCCVSLQNNFLVSLSALKIHFRGHKFSHKPLEKFPHFHPLHTHSTSKSSHEKGKSSTMASIFRLLTVLSISDDCTEDDIFWYSNLQKSLYPQVPEKEKKNINQSHSGFIYIFLEGVVALFAQKARKISRSLTALIFRSIFYMSKTGNPLKKGEGRKTYKIECDFSLTRSHVSNRLDNKSSSKCLDGSIKNTFPIYEVHRVENLFATGKFIFL